jgi:hypothetical protein
MTARLSALTDITLDVGGISISLLSDDKVRVKIPDAYEAFRTAAEPEVLLRFHTGSMPAIPAGRPVFDSGTFWCLVQDPGRWIVCLGSRNSSGKPYRMAVLKTDLLSGDIHQSANRADDGRVTFPLGYPMAEILMIGLLSRGRGVLLHACGVADGGRGLVFAGTSGAGKSTLARLWASQEGAEVLSDDRVIVRKEGGCFMVYGTPFHGDARLASPQGVPLECIYLIDHAPKNRLSPMEPLDVASRLLVRSFPTFWDAEGMAFTVGLLGNLAQTVPCHELGFVPDDRVVDFVRCLR